jgi:anaerobic selenocysteine-containing dehydrogenase
MIETKKTLCNRDCPDACSIIATVEDRQITQIREIKTSEHRGFLCYRTSLFLSLSTRANASLPRSCGAMEVHPISWDEALDLAADRPTTIRKVGAGSDISLSEWRFIGSGQAPLGLLFEVRSRHNKERRYLLRAGDAAQALDFGEEESVF